MVNGTDLLGPVNCLYEERYVSLVTPDFLHSLVLLPPLVLPRWVLTEVVPRGQSSVEGESVYVPGGD